MSKADELGTGRSFGQVPRGRSARGRAKAVTQGEVPAYELVRLQLDEVAPTPLNPRRNFGTEEELTRFGEELRQAQLAACVAVTRDAYLALWADHEARIGSAKHVLINGERRYRSAVHVGLEALDFVVRDDLATSREKFINHLLKENLEREDFDVIERARGVQELVLVCAEESERGARSRAAEQLGKDRSWVTNQLVLLELPQELQVMLSAGSLAERDGRLLARRLKDNPELGAAALLEHLEATKAAAVAAKEQARATLEAVQQASERVPAASLLPADNKEAGPEEGGAAPERAASLLSADNKQPTQTAAASEGKNSADLLSADNKSAQPAKVLEDAVAESEVAEPAASSTSSSPLPGPRHVASDNTAEQSDQGDGKQPRQLPYGDAFYVANHLHLKMEPAVFAKSARLLLELLREHHPEEYSALLKELTLQEQQPV